MKIKRFNENQSYLTVPIDPEFELKLDISKFLNDVKAQFEGISKKLDLNFKISDELIPKIYNQDDDDYMNIYIFSDNQDRELTFEITFELSGNHIIIYPHTDHKNLDFDKIQKIKNFYSINNVETLENILKSYFDL